jgi:hypothetical protein
VYGDRTLPRLTGSSESNPGKYGCTGTISERIKARLSAIAHELIESVRGNSALPEILDNVPCTSSYWSQLNMPVLQRNVAIERNVLNALDQSNDQNLSHVLVGCCQHSLKSGKHRSNDVDSHRDGLVDERSSQRSSVRVCASPFVPSRLEHRPDVKLFGRECCHGFNRVH